MMKFLLTPGLCFIACLALSQKLTGDHYRKEITFTNDNDAYLFNKYDAFYTNGLFLKFSVAGEKRGHKVIRSYELGQMIYTPLIRKIYFPDDIDRPFCGYLFTKYTTRTFLPGQAMLQYSATLGIVGPASLGEAMQNAYHRIFGYSQFTGWQYQVRNELGVDLGIGYARTVWDNNSWLKLVPSGHLSLGSTFTNAKAGIYTILGAFEKNDNSVMWQAGINRNPVKTRRKYELFLYWYPQLIYQRYNATVEGGLFNKEAGAQLADITPWMYQQNLGLCYASGRWTTRLEIIYQSKEAELQKRSQQYVSLQAGYRMH